MSTTLRSPIWLVNYWYPTPYREPGQPMTESSSDVRFRDDGGRKGAAYAFLRYIERMQTQVPGNPYYEEIWGFKLYAEDFGGIDADGYFEGSPSGDGVGRSFCALEIKFDHFPSGWTLRQMVESKIGKEDE